jgi:hypothetical protein
LTATRDALVRVVRSSGSAAVELYATEGSAQWALIWRGTLSSRAFVRDELRHPIEIEKAVFQELDRLARSFAADWVWFATDGEAETAVERSRYARYGYPVSAANVRTSRLHRMRADAGAGASVVHSTLGDDERWVRDLILATWAAED